MDRRLFSTNYFVYKYYSPELDVYYIGSHHCRGWKWGTCSDVVCNYKSSSVEVARLKEERPLATWEMLILGWAQDEDALIAMELSWIRWHIRDPKCLNKKVTSPRRRPAGTGRRRFVEMIDPRGVLQNPRVEHFMDLLAAGWRSIHKANVKIRNDRLRLECCIYHSTLHLNIQGAIRAGWVYGGCRDYDRIGVSQFLETLKIVDTIEELDTIHLLDSAETSATEGLNADPSPSSDDPDTEWSFFLEPY